ncbi:hypothetical protein BCR35DRAFT_316077 [Leucosporidium creatinivorum]|uniref:Myb-like domain-containing protein n=1 Tax=Leucosporidium creatinivorum TaxID=106004 RepID=A0A1Y2D6F6_9BASI|nr:hypothetical protein BCR35DRAFT_316077 [Leucosporidium creatinivorum]
MDRNSKSCCTKPWSDQQRDRLIRAKRRYGAKWGKVSAQLEKDDPKAPKRSEEECELEFARLKAASLSRGLGSSSTNKGGKSSSAPKKVAFLVPSASSSESGSSSTSSSGSSSTSSSAASGNEDDDDEVSDEGALVAPPPLKKPHLQASLPLCMAIRRVGALEKFLLEFLNSPTLLVHR